MTTLCGNCDEPIRLATAEDVPHPASLGRRDVLAGRDVWISLDGHVDCDSVRDVIIWHHPSAGGSHAS